MLIHVDNVKPGMIVLEPIKLDNSKTIILNRGISLNDKIIMRLRNLGFKYIDIQLTKEQELAYIADKEVNATVSQQFINNSREAFKNFNTSKIINNALDLTQTIINSQEFKYSLAEYKQIQDLVSHSIRVASFSIILANHYNDTLKKFIHDPITLEKCKINLEEIAISAMLHDIGKICIDENLLRKVCSIKSNIIKLFPTIQNLNLYKYNEKYSSIYSYLLLEENEFLNANIKAMVLLSSENENGKGLLEPELKYINSRQNFVFGSKIIKLCNMYDEELENMIKENQPLENITAKLDYNAANGIINEELEKLFLEHVPLYSKGVKVKLSNGEYAVVEQSFHGRMFICRPLVRTIPDNELIDLRNERALTVLEICSDEISFIDIVNKQLYNMEEELSTKKSIA